MSEKLGTNMFSDSGLAETDLEVDAEPDYALFDERELAGQRSKDTSSMCCEEVSDNSPTDQPDEISRGSKVNSSTKRPDGFFNMVSDDIRSQQTESIRPLLSPKEVTDHNRKSHEIYLPPELRQEHFDILIIHAEEDRPAAENLKKTIEELHAISVDGGRTPITVGLTEEVASYVRSNVDWLDAAMACCTYIFVIFTQHLVNDCVLREMTNASLWGTFSKERKNVFCPVYLEKGAKRELNLSVYVTERSGVNMWKDPSSYKAVIEQYIDVGPRVERCERQDQEAKQYCDKQCLSSAKDSRLLNQKTQTTSTEFRSDDASKHLSPADLKRRPIKPELYEQCSAVDKPHAEVDNQLQTLRDSHNYLVIGAGVVIGAGLLYLFNK